MYNSITNQKESDAGCGGMGWSTCLFSNVAMYIHSYSGVFAVAAGFNGHIIITVGSDRPAMKYLNRHVAVEIACKWYDVGIELMNTEDEQLLNTMRAQHGSNSIEGSKEMLREWLQRKPDASWIQLIAALKVSSIGLNERARNLERLLSIESKSFYYDNVHNYYSYCLLSEGQMGYLFSVQVEIL